MKTILSIIFILFLYSCNSTLNSDAAEKVAAMFHSSGYTLKKGVQKSDTGSINIVKFSIKNIPVPKGEYEPERIFSAIALAYYNAVSKNERQETNQFEIGIENNGTTISQTFHSGDLFLATYYLDIVDTFCRSIDQKDTIVSSFDPNAFPDSTKSRILSYIYNHPSQSQSPNIIYNGFKMSENPDTKDSYITYWVERISGQKKLPYRLTISKNKKKIVAISVNY